MAALFYACAVVAIADELEPIVLDAWALVEQRTLGEALELLTSGELADEVRLVRLALVALGELPTSDSRTFADARRQPWYHAYERLLAAYRERDRFARLSTAAAWLVVDALIDAGASDTSHNSEQAASGHLWSMVTRAGSDPRDVERRLIALAAAAFEADGYDTGAMDFDLSQLADHVADPKWKRVLRLRHAYLSFATEPSCARRRGQLHDAIADAVAHGVQIEAVRAECAGTIGGWPCEPLPAGLDELDAP